VERCLACEADSGRHRAGDSLVGDPYNNVSVLAPQGGGATPAGLASEAALHGILLDTKLVIRDSCGADLSRVDQS